MPCGEFCPCPCNDAAPTTTRVTNGAKPSSEVKNGTQVTESPSDTGTAPSKARVAAPVITPLNNSGSGNTGTDPRDMNVREMIQTYQKTNKVNFGLRKRH